MQEDPKPRQLLFFRMCVLHSHPVPQLSFVSDLHTHTLTAELASVFQAFFDLRWPLYHTNEPTHPRLKIHDISLSEPPVA